MNEPSEDNSLTIVARPQISVQLNGHDEIEISTARIGDDFRSVEHEEVVIPLCDAQEVIDAMQRILDSRS